jgi:hypothetical protein
MVGLNRGSDEEARKRDDRKSQALDEVLVYKSLPISVNNLTNRSGGLTLE